MATGRRESLRQSVGRVSGLTVAIDSSYMSSEASDTVHFASPERRRGSAADAAGSIDAAERPVGVLNPRFPDHDREMRYLTWVQTGKRQGHFVGALVTTLLVGYAFFWSIKYLHDPAADDIYDPATSALKAYFYIATGAFSLLLMWGLYAVLHFWPTLIVEHVYTLLGYFVGFRLSISDGRIAPLLRGQWFVDRYAEMLAVRDDCVGANATATAALLASGCRSATISRESGTAVILVCGFAWLAGYGGLRPGTFLLLLHLTVGWYLLARAGLDDLDSFPGAAYQDSVFLYMYLLILYLNLRRADAHTRAEFLWIEFLEAKTEHQAACAARRARHTPDWPTRAPELAAHALRPPARGAAGCKRWRARSRGCSRRRSTRSSSACSPPRSARCPPTCAACSWATTT